MSLNNPDRALRRIVADLAALHPEDIWELLDGLEPGHRNSVEGLLRDYTGLGEEEAPYGHELAAVHLSGWLRSRLDPNCADVTEHARDALQRATAQLFPLAPAPRTSLIGKILPGRGAA